jgi:hypothetical protein
MKRFAPLALIVLALALVPAAPTTAPAQQNAGRPGVQMGVEILRLRLQIVQLRFRLHCGQNGNASHDRCVAFAQKVLDKLTKLDGNVQQKIADLRACPPDGTDPKCKNADKKIAILTRVDTHLQKVLQAVQDWLDGKTPAPSDSANSDGALDQAAAGLTQAAGSNG